MDAMMQDIRYALRLLGKSPGFTLVAVLTLGLGIGANTAIFTVANTLFLAPPPQVRAPDELVALYTSDYSGPAFGSTSWPDYLDIGKASRDALSGVAAYAPRRLALSLSGTTEQTFGETVSGNYFDVLGVQPAAGRFFRSTPYPAGDPEPVVVIGYDLWRQRFGADPAAIGQALHLNGQTFTVIGVAPREFSGSIRGLGMQLWVPMSQDALLSPESSALTNRGDRLLTMIGRLAPGVSAAAAQARANLVATQLHAAYPEAWTDVKQQGRRLTLLGEAETRVPPQVRGPVMGFVGMLMLVVSLVLLICCANVANLLLARSARRRREIAVRVALGATRARLMRLLLTESVLLAGVGGVMGVLLATWTTGLLAGLQPPLPVPIALRLVPDLRVLGFALIVTLLTGVVFGLLPARRAASGDLVPALKSEITMVGWRRGRRIAARDSLVVLQVAVSMVLLVMSGLFLRSLSAAQRLHPGFRAEGLVLNQTALSLQGYDSARVDQFYRNLAARAEHLPGVRSVALAEAVPLDLSMTRRGVSVEGYQPKPGEDLEFGANLVGPGYFSTMEIVVRRGREFLAQDRSGAPLVAIVNEAFAQRFWPGEDPIGKRIGRNDASWTVIGVAATGKYASLGEEPKPYFYMPLAQVPKADLTLHLRSADPAATMAAVRVLMHELDPDLPSQVNTMEAHLGVAMLPQRVGATLLGIFGGLGLLIAAIGLYGVMAYTVALRTREIGVRVALGAGSRDVRRLILGHAMGLAMIGMAIGLALALGAGQLASSFLFGVAPTDPVTLLGVPFLLTMVAGVASWLPAHRAMRIDPVAALRSE